MAASCIFCRIAAAEIPARIAYQDETVVAFHDLAPQAPVHVLVVPRAHVASFSHLPATSSGAVFAGVRATVEALGLTDDAGYRLVVNCGETAGQSVFHLHVHVLSGRRFGWPPG